MSRADRHPLRLAFVGELGSGNTGNDGSFEVVLDWVRRGAPDAEIFAICAGPEQVSHRFGIRAEPLSPRWRGDCPSRALRALRRVSRKARVPLQMSRLLRGTDWVIVPGAGVLESTWHRPWMLPYTLYGLTLSARARGTRVALVNVGADRARNPWSRWLVARITRRADYLTVRDEQSAAALRSMHVELPRHAVHPDLGFGLTPPASEPTTRRCVGVGLINYFDWRGTSEEQAANRATYERAMIEFIEWLLEEGHSVRLLTGDKWDDPYLQRVLEAVRARKPGLGAERVLGEPARDLHELMEQLRDTEVVVAARYHNIVMALRLAKPVLALSYAPKTAQVMERFGLSAFGHPIDAIEMPRLKYQFRELYEKRSEIGLELRLTLGDVEADLEDQREQFLAEVLGEHPVAQIA